MTRRGAGGLALPPGARAGRGAARKRGARPHPGDSRALPPEWRSESKSRRAPAATPDRERSPSPACPARPTHCGSAGPGRGPRLPAPGALGSLPPTRRRARLASPPGAVRPARRPKGGPFRNAASQPSARSLGSPHRFPGTRAARTGLGASARSGEMPAPEREGVGRAGRNGSAGAGLGEGGGEDGEQERRRKGARQGRPKKMTVEGRDGVPRA